MILLLSGEGPTDMGSCDAPTGECSGVQFKAGPMAAIVDRLAELRWNYAPLDIGSCILIPEAALSQHCRNKKMSITLPGKKKKEETGYFFKQARVMAQLAKERSARDACPVGAVLFRDSDGTVASRRSLWQDKVNSIENGFAAESFDLGVAMVPKPKSEAWLLCAVQKVKYQNCVRFEDMSGNDNSPNSAKKELAAALQAKDWEYAEVADKIKNGEIDPLRIQMPSFDYFRNRLEIVAQEMNA